MNLSLSSLMKQVDSRESYLDCALNCYRSALANLSAHLIVSDPQLKRQISNRLDRLAAAISRKSDTEALGSTAARLNEILVEYRTEEEAVYEKEQLQVRRTIIALEGLVSTLSKQESEQSDNLNAILQGLESALFQGDLTSIHQTLQDQIRKLRTCLITLSEDRQARDAQLDAEISALRSHSLSGSEQPGQNPEQYPTFDSILSRYMSTYTLFSLLLVKLEDFSEFAKHWNIECRTQVLTTLANRLAATIGTSDRIHTVGEGEFLIVMRCSMARAMEQSAHIKTMINSAYRVELPFGTGEIRINAAIGAVEYIPGEDIASLTARVEQTMRSGPSLIAAGASAFPEWTPDSISAIGPCASHQR